MAEFAIIYSEKIDIAWLAQIEHSLKSFTYQTYTVEQLIPKAQDLPKRLLLLCELDEIGRDPGIDQLMRVWKNRDSSKTLLLGTTIALAIKSNDVFHTKTYAREIIWLLNDMGARFIGKPLVELLPDYENMGMWVKKMQQPPDELYESLIRDLAVRLGRDFPLKQPKLKLIVLHSSDEKTSNTLAFWRRVEAVLKHNQPNMDLQEIYMRRGSITDCIGCPFEVCTTEAKQLSCVLGGQFVSEVMPAIVSADILVWLCPNYNDTIGGDLIALINRMSGLYRTQDLSHKKVYAIVVSGNSGSDTVGKQLIGSLVINKGFQLPPYFCLSEIAGEPLSILKKADLDDKATAFARRIISESCE